MTRRTRGEKFRVARPAITEKCKLERGLRYVNMLYKKTYATRVTIRGKQQQLALVQDAELYRTRIPAHLRAKDASRKTASGRSGPRSNNTINMEDKTQFHVEMPRRKDTRSSVQKQNNEKKARRARPAGQHTKGNEKISDVRPPPKGTVTLGTWRRRLPLHVRCK